MRALRRSLGYFGHVARNLSVRAAADALHIAPSAVSRSVQQLEEEIGVQLFERTPRGLQLTVAGETVLAYMQRWERDAEHMVEAVRSLSGVRLETIRIASVEVATYELLPQATGAVRQRLPGMRVELKVGDTQAVLESMLNGSADIGIVINMPRKAPVRALWTASNPVGLVVPRGHRLARRKALHVADCTPEQLILAEESLAAGAAVRVALAGAGPLRIAGTSNRIVSIKAMVRAGLGISFLTHLDVAAEERAGEFRFIPLLDTSIEHPYVSLLAPKGAQRTAAVDLLVETLRKALPAGEFHG